MAWFQGYNSPLMNQISDDPKLMEIFREFSSASEADKKNYKFILDDETGELEIQYKGVVKAKSRPPVVA